MNGRLRSRGDHWIHGHSRLFAAGLGPLVFWSCSLSTSPRNIGGESLERSAFSTTASGQASESLQFDSTFTIIEDLTEDGEPDSLVVRVVGSGMEHPFGWTVGIWVRRELVFEYAVVDSLIDGLFGETDTGVGSFGLTGNRERDKAWYYFESLPSRVIERTQFEAGSAIFDRDSPAGVQRTLTRELREGGLVDDRAVQGIIDGVVRRLQEGTILLSIPKSPFLSEFPRIYVAEVGEFIPVFTW